MQIRCLSFMSVFEKEEFPVGVANYAAPVRSSYFDRRPKSSTSAVLDGAARVRENVIYDALCGLVDCCRISLGSGEKGVAGPCVELSGAKAKRT